jgi:CRP-like cAMP-binding protein
MAFEDDIATLARAPLFTVMEYEALRLFAFAAEHRTLRQGEILFREGDKSDGGFVVMKGGILVAAKRGSEAFLAVPGALIGQTALFSQSVRAGTDSRSEFECVSHLADADAPRASGVSVVREGRSSCPLDRTVNALRGARARSAAAPQHRAIYLPRGRGGTRGSPVSRGGRKHRIREVAKAKV